jgi:glycosyltransferase involved in cell wall biosynthesis
VEQRKTKIIFTVVNDLTYDQRMIRICTSLAEAGYEVMLVGRRLDTSVPLANKGFHQKRLRCFINKGKFFYVEFNIRLFFYLLFQKVDVYSAVDLDTLVASTFLSKIRSKKLVFDAHEYFEEVPEVTNRPVTKKIWKTVGNWFIPQTDLAYTVNQSLADIFTKQHHKKFEVIRSVPYRQENIKYRAPEQKVILYQGALNEGRGLEAAIGAMKHIDAEFWIVGEGDLSYQLRELVAELQLENKVKFLGFITPQKLPEITQQAYIGYNVFENKGLSYYYSLNNKFFDYIQSAIPQVFTNYPEFQKINDQYHVGVTANCEPAEIVSAINQLLNDEELYLRLKSYCATAAAILNWQHEEKHLVALYKQHLES